jgi:hypothetical protein
MVDDPEGELRRILLSRRASPDRNYLAQASPSGVRRHVKYASKIWSASALGTGPVWGVCAKYITTGFASLKAGHAGTPSPFGSPRLAKFVQ